MHMHKHLQQDQYFRTQTHWSPKKNCGSVLEHHNRNKWYNLKDFNKGYSKSGTALITDLSFIFKLILPMKNRA